MIGRERVPTRRATLAAGSPETNVPDSAASVAGYEYQFLWAALRCIHLLVPNTKSTQVVVESLYGPDIETLEAAGEDLLVVDVAEYEGGETIDTATRIIVSQLKYSPTAPKKNWTINGLCESRSGDPKRSIIGGLGLIFQRFWKAYSNPSNLAQRLLLRLVTNRPLQKEARATIAEAQRLIKARKSSALATTSWLLRQPTLSTNDKNHLNKLKETTGLASTQFPIFLMCLDTTGYDRPALDWLKTLTQKTIVEMGASWREEALLQLLDRVRSEAIQGRRSAIRADDVLAYLFCNQRQFLPAPNRITSPDVVIDTSDIHRLAATIRDSGGQVLAHGAAGKGKSITVSNIVEYLPPGSQVFIYDCFANGEWEGASHGYRHTSLWFCNQIINELAVRFDTGLFYSPKHTAKYDRWTFTQEALNRVCSQIQGEGLFVVVVDAADNARDLYEKCSIFYREDLFLEELWKLPLPDKVRLVVTCRTERMQDVCAPSGVQDFELVGFQPEESCAHLTRRLGSLSSKAQIRFHDATEGTPRLQDYWISNELRNLTLVDREESIRKREVYGIAEEYKSWIESASNALSGDVLAQDCVAMIRCLRQPFSVSDFARCAGVPRDDAHNFCLGLRSGLVLTEKENIEFRDQDFEAVLDDSLSRQEIENAHKRAASWCSHHCQSHPYATRNVAYHLDKSGSFRGLIDLALNLSYVESLPSPDERNSTATECVHLALRACEKERDYSAPLQLTFSLGKLARGRESGKRLFLEYPEICIHNGLYPSVRKALLEEHDENGSIHFRIASSLLMEGEVKTARKHLAEGEAWLNKCVATQDQHGMASRTINVKNSSERGVAHALLDGFSEGAIAATGWKTEIARTNSIFEFSAQLSRVAPEQIACSLPDSLSDPVYLAAQIAGAFSSYIVSKGKIVRKCLDDLLHRSKVWPTGVTTMPTWLVDFAEACLWCRADSQDVLSLFEKFPIQTGKLQPYVASHPYWQQRAHDYVRTLALFRSLRGEALSVREIFPKRRDHSSYSYELENAKSNVDDVLSAYTFRTKALQSNRNTQSVLREARKDLSTWQTKHQRHSRNYHPFFSTYANHIMDTIILLPGNAVDFFDELVSLGGDYLYPTDFSLFCMDTAEKCSQKKEYHSLAQEFAQRAVRVASQHPMKARERGALLLRAGSLLAEADRDVAADIVNQALASAQDVDEDAPHYAKALNRLAFTAGERHENVTPAHAQSFWKALGALDMCAADHDGIDWEIALEGLTALDPNLGYSAMLVLDLKGTLPLPRAMAHYLQAIAAHHNERQYLHLAGVMGPFCNADSSSITILTKLLARLPETEFPSELFAALARLVIRDTRYDSRATLCRTLLDLASSKKQKNEDTEMLAAQVEFYTQDVNWQRQTHYTDYGSSSGRRTALRKLKSKLEKGAFAGQPAKALNAILSSGVHGPELRLLIVEQGQRQRGADITLYLNALCAHDGDGYLSRKNTITAALCDLLATLPKTNIVEKWIDKEYARFVIQICPVFFELDSDYNTTVKVLLELDCVPEEIRTNALLGILCEYGHTLPPRRLFELAGTFAKISTKCSALSIILSELDSVPGNAEDLVVSDLPSDPVKQCLRIIHDAFGHADNRIRWRAFHAFRLAVTWDPERFVSESVHLLKRNDCRLWMSAKDWLLFALLHTSRENPVLLAPHTDTLWELATDDDFPHAGHQELARRILDYVIASEPSALPPEKEARLSFVNRARSCLLGRDGDSVGWKKDFRFDFDSTDTMPYWYSYLGGAFGLHRCDVAMRAEKWICDEWKLTDAKCREEESLFPQSYEYGLTSHRHGARPTVEMYTRYIEWHAMMLAAGEMVKALPSRVEHYSDGVEDKWESWIDGHTFSADVAVLSDLRGPTPLDPVLHGARLSRETASKGPIDEDFRNAFRVSSEEICIAGEYSAKVSAASWTWRIDTALVSKETARSLGLAIMSSGNTDAIWLPQFNIEEVTSLKHSIVDTLKGGTYQEDDESEIKVEKFNLRPWIVRCYSEEEMAGKDPSWRDGGRVWYALGRDVVQVLGLHTSELHNLYTDSDHRQVAWCQVWNDVNADSEDADDGYAAGHRLVMLKSEVVKFMKAVDMDVIVRVSIYRHVENRYGNDEGGYKKDAGVFILRNSGRLENLGIRAEARRKTN